MHAARRRLLGLAAACAFLAPAPAAWAAGAGQTLAERYAPVVRVATTTGCGDEKAYVPTDVDRLFANHEVVLRGPWDTVNVVKVGPTAADLEAGRIGYHLDFPGDALNPGCTYLDWSERLNHGVPPTVYSHVATDSAHPGKLALQYWLFYVYNDFNNKHEGDWEMIQLDFDAANAQDALGTQPVEVGYSQHDGAEGASWADTKLQRVDGTHPVVYPAEGSHANFYSEALFLGRSAAQGVGCDDTTGPHLELRPRVAVIPSSSAAALKSFPWIGFQGHWGELHPAFYNGPTGPNVKTQWTHPITWAESWRDRSYAVPGGSSIGPQATDFFCTAVAAGSNLLTAVLRDPLPWLAGLVAVFLLLLYAASRTTWRDTAPLRLARRRAWGQIVVAAGEMYRSRPATFLAIGVLFIPVSVVIAGAQYLLFRVTGLVPLVETAGESNVSVAGLALSLGLVFTLLALSVVQAATAYAMAAFDRGQPVSALDAYRGVAARLPTLLRAVVTAAVVVALLDLTIVGIPVSIWLLVRWVLLAQVVGLEPEGRTRPLRSSAGLVRGHWWRVASFTVIVAGLGLLSGPFIGGLLLLATTASFNLVNLVAGLIYTVIMPFVAIATTYLYYDLKTRAALGERRAIVGRELPAEI